MWYYKDVINCISILLYISQKTFQTGLKYLQARYGKLSCVSLKIQFVIALQLIIFAFYLGKKIKLTNLVSIFK